MNKKCFDRILVILIIATIVFMIYVVYFMQTEAKECMESPYLYATSKMNGGGLVECVCNHYAGRQILPFKFNNTDWEAIIVDQPLYSRP